MPGVRSRGSLHALVKLLPKFSACTPLVMPLVAGQNASHKHCFAYCTTFTLLFFIIVFQQHLCFKHQIELVIHFPFFPGFLQLRSFLQHMPEKPFLALMSLSTRPRSKSASNIKQPIYLCPTCLWKLLFLKKMDGLRITFHRLHSCPPITQRGLFATLRTVRLLQRMVLQ